MLNKWRDYCKSLSNSYDISLYEAQAEQLDDWQMEASTQDIVEQIRVNEEIRALVEQLPENQRVCMVLFYYEDIKMEEIAALLGIPIGSVKSRLYYGRRQLKEWLEQRGLNGAGFMPAPVAGGAAAKAGIFTRVAAALQAASESAVPVVVTKSFGGGMAVKVGVVFVSLLTAGGVAAAVMTHPDDPHPQTPAVAATHTTTVPAATTTTEPMTAPTTESTAEESVPSATETTTVTPFTLLTTNPPITTTTTAPQPFVAFDYKAVSGGVAITNYRGDEPNVVIPDRLDGRSVVEIGSGAFKYNRILQSVTIPSGVRTIGTNAFRECRSLHTVSLGGGVTFIDDSAFLGCTVLSSLTVPSNVRRINPYAFAYCTGLTRVDFAEGITFIGYSAFRECSSLRYVMLPASVGDIGGDSFDGAAADLMMTAPAGSYASDYIAQRSQN